MGTITSAGRVLSQWGGLLLLLLAFASATPAPPPETIPLLPGTVGDSADNPVVIGSIPVTYTGSTEDFFTNVQTDSGPGVDVFFRFTPTESFSALVSTCGSEADFDTILSIYVGDVLMARNDDAQFICAVGSVLQSGITNFHFLTGNTYTIVLDGYEGNSTGHFMFNIEDVEYLPIGEEFYYLSLNETKGNSMDNPMEISSIPCVVFGSTAAGFNSTHELGEGPDVFFRFTTNETMIANISTCGSKFDTEIGVILDGELIAFNDDDTVLIDDMASFFCDQSDGTTQSALQNIVLTENRTYLFIVDGFEEDSFGQFELVIEAQAAPPSTVGESSEVKSDPHLRGFRGQEFEFVGKPDAMYNFLTTSDITINALLGAAYTTGLQFYPDLEATPMRKRGTWMKVLGIRISEQNLVISSTHEAVPEFDTPLAWTTECADDTMASGSLELGLIFVNFKQFCKIGMYELDHRIAVELRNSRSFSRVKLVSPFIKMKIDIVSPPASWGLDESTLTDEHFHLNFAIDSVIVGASDIPSGILGKTMSDWLPEKDSEDEFLVSRLIS